MLLKQRTVFSKTDWLGVKNTAVTCGTYQFNNGKKKQLWGIILYIRLIQKIEIFLEKWKIIVICLFLKRILKNSPGQILGNKAGELFSEAHDALEASHITGVTAQLHFIVDNILDRFLEIKPSRLLSVSSLSRILSTIK